MFGRTKKPAARAANGFATICLVCIYKAISRKLAARRNGFACYCESCGAAEKSCFQLRSLILAGMVCLGLAGELKAEDKSGGSFTNSTDISLEQLVNIEVTSVSKKETKLNQSPAAIFVITQEDIRRSGLTSIPELLRLAPGMDVAQINASTWAISSRGFNGQYADKLLVLVDGRSVYAPAFAGVFW